MEHSNEYNIFVCVETDDMVNDVIEHLTPPFNIRVNNNTPSFSKMVNDCINDCSADIMIFCSKKVRPTMNDINRIVELINEGYGYVGLYRFACFGIHKKLINTIGYFDEHFIWGGCEDDDFRIRMNYANIGFYEDHSVKYMPKNSTYAATKAIDRWNSKYSIDHITKTIVKNISDNLSHDKLTYSNDIKFKEYTDSIHVKNIMTEYSKNNLHYYTIIDNTIMN
jgi:hypothetical protein